MTDSSHRNIKSDIMTVAHMFKKVNGKLSMLSRDMKYFFMKQIDFLLMKNPDWDYQQIRHRKENANEQKDTGIETTQNRETRLKKKQKHELWDNTKQPTMYMSE